MPPSVLGTHLGDSAISSRLSMLRAPAKPRLSRGQKDGPAEAWMARTHIAAIIGRCVSGITSIVKPGATLLPRVVGERVLGRL